MDDKELFEVWRSQFESQFDDNLLRRHESGAYINNHRQSLWIGFCMAKRSQPSVVLTKRIYSYPMHARKEIQDSLTAAGIKYTIGE